MNDAWGPDMKLEWDIDPNYKSKWPEGYWEKYEDLRTQAQMDTKALMLHMVVDLNGRYHVIALLPIGIGKSEMIRGPESRDRLIAWELFIEQRRSMALFFKTVKDSQASVKAVAEKGVKKLKAVLKEGRR